jgi:methylmalonyl-CoA/ethylmalonyl-CoA epimerase
MRQPEDRTDEDTTMKEFIDKPRKVFPFMSDGVTQIAWVVEDIDIAVEKFYQFTGIGPWHFYRYGSEMLHTMKRHGKDAEYELLAAVANAGATRLELIQPMSGDTIFSEYVEKHGYGGIQHLGLAVDDMEAALAFSESIGIKVTMEGGGHGLDGDGYFAYLDTEDIVGVTLELMERPKKRRKPYKIYPSE